MSLLKRCGGDPARAADMHFARGGRRRVTPAFTVPITHSCCLRRSTVDEHKVAAEFAKYSGTAADARACARLHNA